MTDNRITRGIQELLKQRRIDGLGPIKVETHCGIVWIRGRVTSEFARRACYECCRRVTGVRRVIDELQMVAA